MSDFQRGDHVEIVDPDHAMFGEPGTVLALPVAPFTSYVVDLAMSPGWVVRLDARQMHLAPDPAPARVGRSTTVIDTLQYIVDNVSPDQTVSIRAAELLALYQERNDLAERLVRER